MDRSHRMRGVSTLPVVVLLGLIVAGGYNYHRNWQVEASIPRPYESYAQVDLEALLAAYEAENSQAERRYEAAREKARREGEAGMLDQNIAAFEAAQRQSSQTRSLSAMLSMQQTATGEIEAELERRTDAADPLQVHLKRLLTI